MLQQKVQFMTGLWQSHIDYILFAHGSAFVLLAVSALIIRQASHKSVAWARLAAFGILCGAAKWIEMLATGSAGQVAYRDISFGLNLLAAISLMEYARLGAFHRQDRSTVWWLTPVLMTVGLLIDFKLQHSAMVGAGVTLSLAEVWAALTLADMGRKSTSVTYRFTFTSTSTAFLCHAVLLCAVALAANTGHALNQIVLFHTFHFPLQVLQASLVGMIAIGIWAICMTNQAEQRPSLVCLMTALVIILSFGWVYTDIEGERVATEARFNSLNQCRVAAAGLDRDILNGIKGASYVHSPHYNDLRLKLMKLQSLIPESSLLYTMHLIHGRIIFGVDSARETSYLHTLPGVEYYDAPPELMRVFRSGREDYVEGYTDRWGEWTSSFVPVADVHSGKVTTVIGLDMPKNRFQSMKERARLGAMVTMLLLVLLLCISSTAYANIRRSWSALSSAEKRVRASENRLRSYIDRSPDGILVLDSVGRFIDVNPAACRMSGYPSEDLLELSLTDLLTSSSTEDFVAELLKRDRTSFELTLNSRDGYSIPVALDGARLSEKRHIAFFKDLSQRKRAEEEVIRERERLNTTLHSIGEGVIATDMEGRVTLMNKVAEQMTGWNEAEAAGHHVDEVFRVVSEMNKDVRVSAVDLVLNMGLPVGFSDHTLLITRSGSELPIANSCTPIRHEDERLTGAVLVFRDVTERKRSQEKLDYQAHHDALTGLPNRLMFREELESLVAEGPMIDDPCAVLFVDLDKFKLVNDTMGHEAGDILLIETAARLGSCVRGNDMLARMGGDEFTIILRNVRNPEAVGMVAQRMLEQISVPFEVYGCKLVVGASIGISLYPQDAPDADSLLKNADAAMYRAKELGRNNFQFYTEELNRANQSRVEIESDLRQAMENGELEVYYQPIVNADNMKLVGAEALIRWNHPRKGMISPSVFIPVAEETGLIVKIGRMALETACKQAKRWERMGWPKVSISVNVSPCQLHDVEFTAEVQQILSQTGLTPTKLNLEITETMIGNSDCNHLDILRSLKELGIETSLDDFGTGYSSLSRLKDFPITHVKVDGSFVRDIVSSFSDRAMTESIIKMAHSLGMKVTAEWVESKEQLDIVRSMDCDHIQGFLVCPPLSANDFLEYLGMQTAKRLGEFEAA